MLHTHECIAKTITYNIEHRKALLYNIMNKNPPRVHLDWVLTYDNKHRLHVK